MRITKADLIMAPLKDGFCCLPSNIAIAPNVAIFYPGANVGSNTIIEHGVMIFKNAHIDFRVTIDAETLIGEGVRIEHGAWIGSNVEIGRETFIGSHSIIGYKSRIGRNVHIAPKAEIARGAHIDNDITVNVFSLKYHANYAGERDGVHLFRIGCEIHPLSWFTSRKKGFDENGKYNSGWARVWYLKVITEREYRRYLRFFKNETKRLGIKACATSTDNAACGRQT